MRTIIGVIFISLVMTPGEMYLGLVTGGGIGAAAQWVTVILFLELAKRSFTSLRRQEIYLLVYVASALVAREEGAFLDLLFRQYFVRSVEAEQFGISKLLPFWYVPHPEVAGPGGADLPAPRLAVAHRAADHGHHRRPRQLVHLGVPPLPPDIRPRTPALSHGPHVGPVGHGPGRGERRREGDLEVAHLLPGGSHGRPLRDSLCGHSHPDRGPARSEDHPHPDPLLGPHAVFREPPARRAPRDHPPSRDHLRRPSWPRSGGSWDPVPG